MSTLGARFDAWLTTDTRADAPDEPLPGDPDWPTCTADGGCGAWLRRKPDDVTPGWTTEHCTGQWLADGRYSPACGEPEPHPPHDEVFQAWDTERRVCRRCGRNNYQVVV